MFDSVTDPPGVIAPGETLKPKIEIVLIVGSHEYTTEPSGLNSRTFGVGVENIVPVETICFELRSTPSTSVVLSCALCRTRILTTGAPRRCPTRTPLTSAMYSRSAA